MTQVAVQTTRGVSSAATEILFVDAGVPESEILLAGLAPQVEVVRLADDRGGVEQITGALAGRTGVAALHILGHGRAGQIDLGNGVLGLDNLADASDGLLAWRDSLTDGADILVYGCDVAGSADGAALIAQLAQLTGADVAASTDSTGASALGGNWTLGMQVGRIETALPFSAQAMAAWRHTLNHFRYGTMSWEPVPGSPNTVIIKGQVDWTNNHGHIPPGTPIGGIVADRFTLNFGDGTTQSVAVRVISRDPVTNDVLTEFVSDINNDGTIGANEVGVRHTYASAGNYEVFWNGSAREAARSQNTSTWQQDMRIDLTQAGNRSPVVATPSVIQVIDNAVFTYQIAASDPDGNPLRFRYGTQDEFYNNGAVTEATRPTGLTLTPGGLIIWDVSDAVVTTAANDRWQVTIMAEDLDGNGNVRSFVPVDFVLRIVPAGSQPPIFTQLPPSPQTTPAGQTSTFTVEMDDPDTANAPAITVLNPPSIDPAIFSTTTSVSADGKTTLTISFTPNQDLKGKSYVLNVRGRDGAGLTSDQSVTLTVPNTLTVAAPSDTGRSSTDSITSDTTPTVTGRTDPGSTVTVQVDGVAVGTTTADGAGNWSFTPGTALADGIYNMTFTATDTGGNTSAVSAALPVTIDTAAPAVPSGLLLTAASDSGAAGDNLTRVALPTITGTADAGSIVNLYSGATLIGTGTALGDGTWSITATVPLTQGANALTATASDVGGNTSAASGALSVTLDSIAPAAPAVLAIASASDSGILGDRITSVAAPVLTGTAEANSTLTLSDGATVLGTTQADGSGAWSFTPTAALADGAHSVTATATDAAANVSPVSTAFALTIDTVAPAAPAVLAIASASDSGILGDGITSVPVPVLTGTAEANSTVTLFDGATVLGTAVANGAGQWSFTPAAALADGARSVTATATDAAGNASPASSAFALTIDTAAPTAPGNVALAPASDSGLVGDGVTSNTTPTLTGTAEAGSTITLSDGATVLGTAVADGSGQWSFTPGAALADGAHSVTATATDSAGNASPASVALALAIDSTAPAAPAVLAIVPASDSGALGDGVTSVTAPALTGTAEANSTVTLSDGAAVLGTTTADGSGQWSFTPGAPLAEGAHSIAAIAADSAGNASPVSTAFALTIDTAAPAAPAVLAIAPASDSGAVGDGITSVASPALTGTAEAGSTVTLSDGATVLGTVQADGAGLWSFTPASALAEGAHSVAATAADAAGNVSPASAAFALTIDTAGPTPPAALTIAPGSDTGAVGDGITSVASPVFTGTAEAGSTVTVSDGATVLGTIVADSAGQWSFTPAGALAEGAHSITATAADAAGNASPASAALALTIDSSAPVAPISLVLTPGSDSGAAGDNRTNIATPTLAGTAEASSTVTLSDGATVLGRVQADATGQWSFTPAAALAEGAHSITAAATDAAGNASPASAALALAIDTTAPVVTEALVQDTGLDYDGITSDPTLTGTADPGDAVTLTEGGAVLGTALADTSGAWRFTPVGLAEGRHTITASDTDAAGNTGRASLSFVLDTAPPTSDYTLRDSSGVQSDGVLAPTGQDASGIARAFDYGGTDGVTILARADNARLKGGAGGDAIVARGGRSVLDGNGGSDWLVGGTGQNSFVVDVRGGTWNTVIGFKAGDDIAVRGIQEVASTFRWVSMDGASGYQGATLRGAPDGAGQAFSVTFAGLTVEEAKRYAAVVEQEADGTPVLRLRAASPAAPDDATYAITDTTTGVVSISTLDPYAGTAPGLRYQHVEAGSGPAVLLARASDSLLQSGAGNDALAVRNGDNVLDAGGGSNWLVGGAGNDTFIVDARGGPVWDTVVNFHAGDQLVMRGYQEGVSSWAWTAVQEGAAGYEGATLRGALNGRDTDFSLTLAGISVEEARGYTVGATTSDGVGALSIRA